MKKFFYTIIVLLAIGAVLQGCDLKSENTDNSQPSDTVESNLAEDLKSDISEASDINTSDTSESEVSKTEITEEMAYEGVYNYCHTMYDWSIAEDNPSMMYLKMGDESETEYQVIFRSYTGSFVRFYVDKSNGITRMIEYVPTLEIESEAGTINLFDYL